MKKNSLLFLIFILLFLGLDTHAEETYNEYFCCATENDFYAKVLGGVNFLQNTSINQTKINYQTGYIVAGSLGYSWCYGLNLEFEYAFRRNSIKKIHFYNEGSSKNGHLQTSSYMGNLLWKFPLAFCGCAFSEIQSFIGAGAGYDFQQLHSSNSRIIFDQKWKKVSWQVMAGLAYPIFCNTEVTLEYKFHWSNRHFYNHSVGIGLVYKFDFLKY